MQSFLSGGHGHIFCNLWTYLLLYHEKLDLIEAIHSQKSEFFHQWKSAKGLFWEDQRHEALQYFMSLFLFSLKPIRFYNLFTWYSSRLQIWYPLQTSQIPSNIHTIYWTARAELKFLWVQSGLLFPRRWLWLKFIDFPFSLHLCNKINFGWVGTLRWNI